MTMTTIHRIEVPIPFPLKSVNCYFVEDSIPTLIDTGVLSKEGFRLLKEGVMRTGNRIEDIKRIILTHGHTDHSGLAGELSSLSGAQVYIHCWDVNKTRRSDDGYIEEVKENFSRYFKEAGLPREVAEMIVAAAEERYRRLVSPLPFHIPLKGGEVFRFDDFVMDVIHTPGHSAGSICLLIRERGILFSGDTLLPRITPNPISEVLAPEGEKSYKALEHFDRSLDRIGHLDVTLTYPGHGEPIRDHPRRVEELKSHHRSRKNLVLNILKNGCHGPETGMTQYQIAKRLFVNKKEVEMFLCLSEVRAHLEILEGEGLVERSMLQDSFVYLPTS